MNDTLMLIAPCYNEADTLPFTAPVMKNKINELIEKGLISDKSGILFVDDGSRDGTWETICGLCESDSVFSGVKLSHNSGQQNAFIAGMTEAIKKADCIVTMDCDLQDDINAVDEMLARYYEGNEIVFGVHSARDKDSFLKKETAHLFYKLITSLDNDIIPENANFRLMSRKAVEMFLEFPERTMFMPGLVRKVGLKTATVQHERLERKNGTTKYTPKKMFNLAMDAITSFSSAPLVIFTLGAIFSFILAAVCFVLMIVFSVRYRTFSTGFALLTSVWLISFILCSGLRLLGEYITKNLYETKQRPRYQIEQKLNIN